MLLTESTGGIWRIPMLSGGSLAADIYDDDDEKISMKKASM